MSKLFELKKPPLTPEQQHELETKALEAAELDEVGKRLGQALGASHGVEAIRYKKTQRGKWVLEHAKVGDDYVMQLFALKEMRIVWQDAMTMFIAVLDGIFPKSVQIYYKPPNKMFEITFFTIRVSKVCALPGWDRAIDRAMDALLSVNAWPVPVTSRPG